MFKQAELSWAKLRKAQKACFGSADSWLAFTKKILNFLRGSKSSFVPNLKGIG